MRLAVPLPSRELLRELLSYDPETGLLTWLKGRRAGHIAGSDCGGGLQVQIKGRAYMAHRIIWKMETGSDPACEIDHRDLNGLNNRWENLREATTTQNGFNKKPRSRIVQHPKGVYPYGKGWCVLFSNNRVRTTYYKGHDYGEACRIALETARVLHGEFYQP